MNVDFIYRDNFIMAVNKPPGLLSVPGIGPENQDCMIARLLSIEPEAKVVHRIDCHTSGIMLFAIGIDMQRALSRIFHDRKIDKQYVALTRDWLDENAGVINYPIRCDINNRPRQVVDYQYGKHAVTEWEVMQRGYDRVRLLLKPETGRTHQLRVHCASMGHPVIGDTLYGNDEMLQSRMLLHADTLVFMHPVTGKPMTLSADCEF
jgi:tRNA pseudouridine32 synthase/23S rRNA pseudouridine746 synthase